MDLDRILINNNLQKQTLPKSTGTAEEAAQALDCQLAQIAKSICFWAAVGDPHSVFDISPKKLKKITNSQVARVK